MAMLSQAPFDSVCAALAAAAYMRAAERFDISDVFAEAPRVVLRYAIIDSVAPFRCYATPFQRISP